MTLLLKGLLNNAIRALQACEQFPLPLCCWSTTVMTNVTLCSTYATVCMLLLETHHISLERNTISNAVTLYLYKADLVIIPMLSLKQTYLISCVSGTIWYWAGNIFGCLAPLYHNWQNLEGVSAPLPIPSILTAAGLVLGSK